MFLSCVAKTGYLEKHLHLQSFYNEVTKQTRAQISKGNRMRLSGNLKKGNAKIKKKKI